VIYLDGSALCRFLPGVRHYEAFGAWARDHGDELVTTQLGFTELRQAAELYPRSAAERVLGIVETVRTGVAVIRFSDDNVTISSHATAVLKPFAALHVGAAVAHEKVDTIVTYDPALANVARIYDLAVVSPGLPQDWYAEYEGPSEHWRPISLDAPYAPGVEFDVPEVTPKVDAYENALREAEAKSAAGSAAKAVADAAREAAEATDAGEDVEVTTEGDAGTVQTDDARDDIGKPKGEIPEGEASEFERALHEAEAAVLAVGEKAARGSDVEPEARGETDEEQDSVPSEGLADDGAPRTGTYRPRIEAWYAGDDGLGDPALEPEAEPREPEVEPRGPEAEGEAPAGGGGLPWAQRPESEVTPPPASSPKAPPPLRTEEYTIAPEGALPDAPLALAPPAPVGPGGVPNLPREERGVPPVAPAARPSIGSPVRRPMFETEPHPDSRASRPPDPVPPTPPEESKPLTVPIKWNVELDEPEAYAPVRVEPDTARALPSFPVSFAGGQGGLTLESPGSVSVPALEPSVAARSVSPANEDVRSPEDRGAGSAAPSARERKAAEKAAKRERERIEKLAKKAKAPVPRAPAQASQASAPPAPQPASPPTPPQTAGAAEAWKLDDVVNFGKKKKDS